MVDIPDFLAVWRGKEAGEKRGSADMRGASLLLEGLLNVTVGEFGQ